MRHSGGASSAIFGLRVAGSLELNDSMTPGIFGMNPVDWPRKTYSVSAFALKSRRPAVHSCLMFGRPMPLHIRPRTGDYAAQYTKFPKSRRPIHVPRFHLDMLSSIGWRAFRVFGVVRWKVKVTSTLQSECPRTHTSSKSVNRSKNGRFVSIKRADGLKVSEKYRSRMLCASISRVSISAISGRSFSDRLSWGFHACPKMRSLSETLALP